MLGIGWGRRTLQTIVVLLLPLIVLASGGSEARGATQDASTVADLNIWAFPIPDRVGAGSGNCIGIGPGTLNVWVRLGAGSGVGPIEFFLHGHAGRDPASKIETVVNRDESFFSLRLNGGVYCYSVRNGVSLDHTATPDLVNSFAQSIHLLMTLTP